MGFTTPTSLVNSNHKKIQNFQRFLKRIFPAADDTIFKFIRNLKIEL